MIAADLPIGDADEQAAWWFSRIRSGETSAEERIAFDRWLEGSPLHAAAADRCSMLWSALGEVRDDPQILELRENLRGSRSQPLRYAAGIASVGAVAMLLLIWPHEGRRPIVSPGIADKPLVTRFETGVGQVSKVALADGSTVILDTDSALKAEFDGSVRRIFLQRGRAFFRVAHEQRPFSVTGRRLSVTATGTQFVVDLDDPSDVVSMVEGRVIAVPVGTPSAKSVALVAGRSLTASGRGWQLGTVDVDNVRGWTTGELTFRNAPLEDVVRETNRYSPRKIVLSDPGVGRERLSAVLKAGDVDTLAAAVQDLGIAHASSRDAGSITLLR
jgi:transmembrane sensor